MQLLRVLMVFLKISGLMLRGKYSNRGYFNVLSDI